MSRITILPSTAAVLLAMSLLVASSSLARAEEPTQEIVEKVLKRNWEKEKSATQVKVTLTLNSMKLGAPAKANAQDVVDGIPEGATAIPAIVDFTVRTYYTSETQAVQRVREAKVYKDAFGEWAIMTGSRRGEDKSTTEPAAK